MQFVQNIQNIISEVYDINKNANIVGVTKTISEDLINLSLKAGINTLGENRVQEFLSKYQQYHTKNIHFIGTLQTNKVKYIIDKVTLIQSIDSIKLLSKVNELSEKNDKIMDVLIQINISKEQSKSGILAENLNQFLDETHNFKNVNIRGLMAIPNPFSDVEYDFYNMNELFLKHKKFDILSMGMSNDYKLALKHGATTIRLGRVLYGNRK